MEKQGVGVTDTVYFGGRPIARFAPAPPGQPAQWTDLIYGPTGLLAEVPGTQTGAPVFRVTDHLGSTVGSLLADGAFVNPVDYTPFGQVFSGATSDPYGFTGYEHDPESGLDYASARHFSSTAGHFMSPDPSGLMYADQTNPQSLNLYSYVLNNPLKSVDPTGLWHCTWSFETNDADPSEADGGASENDCDDQGGTWTGDSGDTDFKLRVNVYQFEWGPFNEAWTMMSNGSGTVSTGDGYSGPAAPWVAPSKDPCYNKQLASAGVGPTQLRQRIGAANLASNLFGLLGYASLVRTGGPQDDKNLPQNHSVFGPLPNAVAAGNISFGVTCPFGAAFCQFAAGLAQTLALHPNFSGTLATGFDTPADNAQIRIGQAMRAAGCHN